MSKTTRFGLLALASVVAFAACEVTMPAKHTPSGSHVSAFYVRDANTGRCLRFEHWGKGQWVKGADERMCQGESRPEPTP